MQIPEEEDEGEIFSVGRSPLSDLPGVDVGVVLDWHDVEVTLPELPRGRASIADTVVDHCGRAGSGLLVISANQNSPLCEDLLGGVTDDIDLQASLPVLISHQSHVLPVAPMTQPAF